MQLYDRLGATAYKRLLKYGTTGVLTRTTPSYDPVTQQSTNLVQTVNLPCMLMNIARVRAQTFDRGSLVTSTSTGFLIACHNAIIVPAIGDTFVVNGISFKFVWVSPEDPQGNNPIITTAFGNR